MAEPVRHRQTKGAETDMFEPKATASHLDSTRLVNSLRCGTCLLSGHSGLSRAVCPVAWFTAAASLPCKRNLPATGATNWRDGQITSDYQKLCQVRKSKINRWLRRANQKYDSRHPAPPEGRRPSSQTRGREVMDVRQRLTSVVLAYGEIVWVRRPDAGVKFEGG